MAYKDPDQQREFQRLWRLNHRLDWLDDNGPCVQCGSDVDLEIDHIDPKTKVSHSIWSWSKERREVELKKCQVLCKICHLKKTIAALKKPLVHGTRHGYDSYKCKCDLCKKANREGRYERKRKQLLRESLEPANYKID